jgi:hypothetical protein
MNQNTFCTTQLFLYNTVPSTAKMDTAENMSLSTSMQFPCSRVPATTQIQTAESMSLEMPIQFPWETATATKEMKSTESMSLSMEIQSQKPKSNMPSAVYQVSQPNVQVKLWLGPSSSNSMISRKFGVRSNSSCKCFHHALKFPSCKLHC